MVKMVQIVEVTAKLYATEEEASTYLSLPIEDRDVAVALVKERVRDEFTDFDEVSVNVRVAYVDEGEGK